jgi:receptor protein-tyrosine kinase
MLDAPDGRTAEAFRFLRAAIQPDLRHGVRTLMVTSAVPAEGKSAVAADLAVALARAGHDVVLADLNFRRPAVARLFGLEGNRGLADFALGTATLDDVLCTVEIEGLDAVSGGSLHVVPAGSVQVTGEFWTAPAFTRTLERVSDAGTLVVYDGPALLGPGSAAPLARHVDALLLVARIGALRRPSLSELRRMIPTLAAPTLGFVAVGGTARLRHARLHPRAREVAA